MESWYIADGQPTFNGGYEPNDFNNYVYDGFEEVLETQLASDIILCGGQYNLDTATFETEVESRAVIQNKTFDAYTQGFKRQMLTRITDKVAQYKYIKAKDTLGNWQIYLIMTMPDTNQMYDKVIAHECNYILKWQDKSTGTIYTYPCLVENASQYNTGEQSVNSVIKYGFSQIMCWLSLDNVSINIKREYRFFVDYNKKEPLVYRTTSMDRVAYSYNENRILRLVMTEDLYNPDVDSIKEWICDYINPDSMPQPTEPIVISYSGKPEIKIGGRKTLRVQSESTIVFALIVSDMWRDKISLTQETNQCVIRCDNDTLMVGASFKVVATDGIQTSELLINVKGAI